MIKQRLQQLIIGFSMLLCMGTMLVPAAVSAETFTSDACKGVNALSSNDPSGKCGSSKALDRILKFTITTLSVIVGVVSVIMIVVGGLKYVTSAGDSTAISNARNTIMYALVGLLIAAIAQVLVHFVLKGVANS